MRARPRHLRVTEVGCEYWRVTGGLNGVGFVRLLGPVQIVLSGRNLATWTQWPGLDPEINSLGRGAITRDDASAVPLPRRVMLGLEVGY